MALPEYGVDNFQMPTAVIPAPNQKILGSMGTQMGLANKYREDMTSRIQKQSDAMYDPYASQSRRQLAENIKGVRSDFNRRGLLNSGMRASAETGARADTVSDLNAYRSNLNNALYNQNYNNANTLENNALNSAYQYAGVSPGLGTSALSGEQNALNTDIANAQYGQTVAGGVASGFGQFASNIFARRNKGS